MAWKKESLREYPALLVNVALQDNIQDSWWWLLDPNHGYSVRGTYRYLTTYDEPMPNGVYNNVWHKLIPSKMSLFAWWLLQDRIPTRSNLVSRHVIQPIDNLCVGGYGDMETSDHLFIGCNLFGTSFVFGLTFLLCVQGRYKITLLCLFIWWVCQDPLIFTLRLFG